MRKLLLLLILLVTGSSILFAEGSDDYTPEMKSRIHELEQQLLNALQTAQTFKDVRYYKDHEAELKRKENIVTWDQKAVKFRNQITKLKKDASFRVHRHNQNKRIYYYKNRPKNPPKN